MGTKVSLRNNILARNLEEEASSQNSQKYKIQHFKKVSLTF